MKNKKDKSEDIKNQQSEVTGETQLTEEDVIKLMSEMQAGLEKLEKEAEESHTRYLRALADFDNFRKRQREDVSRQIANTKEDIITKMLAIYDNFNRAAASAEKDNNFDALLEGVKMLMRQLDDFFAKEGVEPIEAIGQEFNPELHEALMRIESDEEESNTITQEFEKGYTLNGKVLRPSKVQVVG